MDGPLKARSAAEITMRWGDGDISERRALLTSALGSTVVYIDPFNPDGENTNTANGGTGGRKAGVRPGPDTPETPTR